MNMSDKALQEIRRKRNLTLRDLYFKINKEISLVRLSDINIGRELINRTEISILSKYLKLTEEEIKSLEESQEDKEIIEMMKTFDKVLELVPKDLKTGQEVFKKCPKCGNKLRIARASVNGHLWITCEKEGVLLCE